MTAKTMAALNGVLLHRLIRGTFARTSKDPKIDFTGSIYDFASFFAINSQRKNFQLILLISVFGLGALTFLASKLLVKPAHKPILIETRRIITRK